MSRSSGSKDLPPYPVTIPVGLRSSGHRGLAAPESTFRHVELKPDHQAMAVL